MKKKFYYLIEDIDINGDNNTDGFIITKYKINSKTNDKIFLKTKYVSIKDFQKKMLVIRLKQDIKKLKKNITISKKIKKGGLMERHPYVDVKAEPLILSENLLAQLEGLKKEQNNKEVDYHTLFEKLKNIEEKIQPQYNQPHYNHPQYNQPQYNQPQYNQLQYNQPHYNHQQYNQIMSNRGFDNYMNNNVADAPPVIVSLHGKKPTMQDNIIEGFGLGAGFAVADNMVDMFF